QAQVGLEAAAGADPDQAARAELDQLLDHDRRARAAHAGRLHRDGLALEAARIAEHAALAVHLAGVVQELARDPLGPQRVARQEHGGRVVALVRAEVDRHGGRAYRDRPAATPRARPGRRYP